MIVPSKVFFTKGVGRHKEPLTSFELALRDAGIEKFNLVQVSSIFPPKCRIVRKEEGLKELSPGLRKRMQGKSCFNFTTISDAQAEELSELTRRGVEQFTEVAQLEDRPTKSRGGRTRG